MKNRILHILPVNTFTIPFVKFVNKEFDSQDHIFLFTSNPGNDLTDFNKNIRVLHNRQRFRINILKNIFLFFSLLLNSRKIILHGLPPLSYYILFPWVLKKTFWTIYGYEIYRGKSIESKIFKLKKEFVLKRVAGYITHIKGDADLAKKIFKSNAKYYYSPTYLSNVVLSNSKNIQKNITNKISYNILIGNSASPTNNHSSIFKLLESYKSANIKIYCPLSYGNYPEYRNNVIDEGKNIFNDKFIPITDFMIKSDYEKFLQDIDIVIFNHNRQEAMGVTISLLGMGKTIYMNSNTSSYKSLQERGFKIFDIELIKKEGFSVTKDISDNYKLIDRYYSYDVLRDSWKLIFKG